MSSKVVVLGNCQADVIAAHLIAGGATVTIPRLPPVYEMTDDLRETVVAELKTANLIFAQRVSDDYPLSWVRTSELTATFGERFFSWPNVYFDGYFPDVQYLYRPVWDKVLSPLEDYHFGTVIQSFLQGRSASEAVQQFVEHTGDGDSFDASLRRLREREAGLNVVISDFVAEAVSRQRTFYTPNHPYPFVMVEMARRLAAAANLIFNPETAMRANYRLDRIYIPTHRAIQRSRRLRFDFVPLYRGREVLSCNNYRIELGAARGFDIRQMIEAYYRIYDQVFCDSFTAGNDTKATA